MSQHKQKPVKQVFDDLDEYLAWCVEYGYVFDEKDLYKQNSNWSYFQRNRHGDRHVRNNWIRDSKQFAREQMFNNTDRREQSSYRK